ncbi:hypothetical protein [Belnapia sp. F-4-1]|uniref:hypothetical protein n=1 Tax=Belnapia sp. F-4-1 TaxID=1545443 RepID=UPI0005BD6988|nr:hypothetical protein [Belnapia sp. F-4-1]
MAQGARPTRRRLLATALAALPAPAFALLPATATLLVPGPEDGPLADWSNRLAAALARGSTAAVMLERSVLGGPDGVTAANRFATAAAPDGRSLLVLPGAAAQARLVGDQRARFDGAGWVPVCAAQGPALLAGRGRPPAATAPLRLGLAAPDQAGAAALLGLDLIGHAATPVLGLAGARADTALAQGMVEAVVMQGGNGLARLAALGAQPWFVLDEQRDPSLPEVPAVTELATGGDSTLRAGLLAAAANARLLGAVLLPALTPGDLVALWRAAAQRWLEEERATLSPGIRLSAGADLAPVFSPLAPPPEAVLAYREWLFRRLRWKPD